MTDPDRISKLIALMGIAFCWAHLTGEWLHHQKPIKLKKHGRKEISVFRYGFDHLRDMLLNINEKYHEFKKMVRLLRRCLISGSPGFARMDEKRNRQYILKSGAGYDRFTCCRLKNVPYLAGCLLPRPGAIQERFRLLNPFGGTGL